MIEYLKTTDDIYGYVQLDPKNFSIIDPDSFNPSSTLYIYQDKNATYNGFNIRLNSPVTGTKWVTCPKGRCAQVLSVLDVQSDGYQWVKVKYTHTDGVTREGFVQFDTYKHNMMDKAR